MNFNKNYLKSTRLLRYIKQDYHVYKIMYKIFKKKL